jgi:hypothetical protein
MIPEYLLTGWSSGPMSVVFLEELTGRLTKRRYFAPLTPRSSGALLTPRAVWDGAV